jgi:hypothetical protein
MGQRVRGSSAIVAVLLAGSAQADEPSGRFDYEAAVELGAHTIGDEEAQMGETAKMFALRLLGAPGGLGRVGDGLTEVGGHAVVAGMFADRGGGLSAGADVMVRRHASPDRAFDARLTLLAGVVGDDGQPPWMILPGVGAMIGETFSIRIEGEMSKKDIGEGYGFGAYAGVGFSGKGAAIASGVIAAVGLSLFAIAVGQLGP